MHDLSRKCRVNVGRALRVQMPQWKRLAHCSALAVGCRVTRTSSAAPQPQPGHLGMANRHRGRDAKSSNKAELWAEPARPLPMQVDTLVAPAERGKAAVSAGAPEC